NSSLDAYLSGSAGLLTSTGDLNVGVEYKLVDGIKIYGSWIDGVEFDKKWQKAYDVRQAFLLALSNESKRQLELSEKNAIISAVGKYDPNVLSISQGTMLLYTDAGLDGKVKQYIENNASYELSQQGVDGSQCISIGVDQFKIAWLHPFPIANVHLTYGMKVRINPEGADYFNIGFACLDENYVEIKRISKRIYAPAGAWFTSPDWYISDTTPEVFHPNTKYVRPFLFKENGGPATKVDMVRFYDAQDEMNQGTVEDIFADNKVTPDEKKTLKGIYEQVKEEHSEMVDFITNHLVYKSPSGENINATQWEEYKTYVTSYQNFKLFYDGILKDMDTTIEISTTERDKISALQASFYKNKQILADKIQKQIKSDVVAVDDLSVIRDEIVQTAIKNGVVVMYNTLIMDKNIVYSEEEMADRGEIGSTGRIPALQISSTDKTANGGSETRSVQMTQGGLVFTRNGLPLSSIRNILIKDISIVNGESTGISNENSNETSNALNLSGWKNPRITLAPTEYAVPIDFRGLKIYSEETYSGSQQYIIRMKVTSAELQAAVDKSLTTPAPWTRTVSYTISEVAKEVNITHADLHTIIRGINYGGYSDTFAPFGGCDANSTGDGVSVHELWGRAHYTVTVTARNSFTQDVKTYTSTMSHDMNTGFYNQDWAY
ncbi:MAG: hypothetical protein ACRC6B_05670, partial [Fusobacteriaceae bacterium]